MKKVILWDFDGTLGYRDGIWSGTLAELIAEHHPELDMPLEVFRPYTKQGFPWDQPDVPHLHLTTADLWWEALEPLFVTAYRGAGLPEERAAWLSKRVRQQYLDRTRWWLFDDTLPTLQTLQERGWTHVIISNHVPELEQLIESLGLAPFVHLVVNSAWIGYEKPHPAIYRHALEELGHPQTVWMVGDNPEADVRGAERAGIPAILVRKHDESVARCCSSLADVIAHVEG
ncbi:MAG: HAD family hydrolase [Tumebacillaceae bacterium]